MCNYMEKHLSVNIFGRVQGVFFRQSAKKKADELGLNGWIQNQTDGTVYAELEGEEVKLNEFLEWAKEGPDIAKVKDIKFEFSDNMKNFRGFDVR